MERWKKARPGIYASASWCLLPLEGVNPGRSGAAGRELGAEEPRGCGPAAPSGGGEKSGCRGSGGRPLGSSRSQRSWEAARGHLSCAGPRVDCPVPWEILRICFMFPFVHTKKKKKSPPQKPELPLGLPCLGSQSDHNTPFPTLPAPLVCQNTASTKRYPSFKIPRIFNLKDLNILIFMCSLRMSIQPEMRWLNMPTS